MQFYDVIENRISVKKFENTPVDKDSLARAINAAMRSPSWKNNTSYRFILVDDPREKDLIAEAVLNDTNESSKAVKQAPMVAIVVADPSKSGVVADKEYYLVDSAIAMEHFMLAATNEGYGTCWIGAFDENKIRRTLSIPNNNRVVAITPIGKASEIPKHHDKKDVSEYVFLNKWGDSYTKNYS
ncbi:nitroreductase family protein [Maledivibacter halophilus]|uniref:Nitroreductase n=1 Tax=Maledivibacter halophilus TaxID=36842 RepID=A0A1T5MAG5_9FIRM|nr:nitroreductase family protein [Maledivibacter halophilus]SKC84828.1 Nitroreductase [Maledivibacter halophilus]